MEKSAVSIIIPNWNGASRLARCLAALDSQQYQDFEVIVVDNGSTDDWRSVLDGRNRTESISFPENRGFAVAANTGIAAAEGRLICLLNNDSYPRPDWLIKLVEALNKFPEVAAVCGTNLRYDDTEIIDTQGCEMLFWGAVYCRGGKPFVEREDPTPFYCFSVPAAGALYRKKVLDEIGTFWEPFFTYFEDTDLSARINLAGYRCMVVPDACCLHEVSSTGGYMSDFYVRYGSRNIELLYLSTFPPGVLLITLLPHIAYQAIVTLVHIFQGRGRPALAGRWMAARELPMVLQRRREISRLRSISSFSFLRRLSCRGLEEKVRKAFFRPSRTADPTQEPSAGNRIQDQIYGPQNQRKP